VEAGAGRSAGRSAGGSAGLRALQCVDLLFACCLGLFLISKLGRAHLQRDRTSTHRLGSERVVRRVHEGTSDWGLRG
jgi:hypothetical protein